MSTFAPGLEEALHDARTGKQGERAKRDCTLCIVLRHTPKGVERDALSSAAAGTISARALHRALRELGVRIDRAVINIHRNEAHSV
jgi:hypothetical protein